MGVIVLTALVLLRSGPQLSCQAWKRDTMLFSWRCLELLGNDSVLYEEKLSQILASESLQYICFVRFEVFDHFNYRKQ